MGESQGSRIPPEHVERASRLLRDPKGGALEEVKEAAGKSRNGRGVLARWSLIVEYLLHPNVSVSSKALFLGAVLYVVLPDPFPGPIDDLIVAGFVFPRIDRELKRLADGEFDTTGAPEANRSSFGIDIHDAQPRKNPFTIDMSVRSIGKNPFDVNET
jgi:uncharacterized membrane protein YkvA (DUF1232 family)